MKIQECKKIEIAEAELKSIIAKYLQDEMNFNVNANDVVFRVDKRSEHEQLIFCDIDYTKNSYIR